MNKFMLVVCVAALWCCGTTIKVDVYGQWNVDFGFKNILIWNKILDDINTKPILSSLKGAKFNFRHVYEIGQLSTMEAQEKAQIGFTVKGIMQDNVTMTFGPYNYCLYEPEIASVFNKPMFSQRCADSRAVVYDSFVRFKPSANDLAKSLIATLSYFKWGNVVFLRPWVFIDEISILGDAIEGAFKDKAINYQSVPYNNGVYPGYIGKYPSNPMVQAVMSTYLTTRVYVILSDDLVCPTYLMSYLDQMGLLQTGEYVVIGIYTDTASSFYSYNATVNQNIIFPSNFQWLNVQLYRTAPALKSFIGSLSAGVQWRRHFLGIIRSQPIPGKLDDLQNSMTFYQLNSTAWHNETKFLSGYRWSSTCKISSDDILTYDVAVAYAEAVSVARQQNISLHNGVAIVKLVTNRTHTSVAGYDYTISAKGVTEGNTTFLYVDTTDSLLIPNGYFTISSYGSLAYHEYGPNTFKWLYGQPVSEPTCGFDGTDCIFLTDDTWKWATIGAIVAFVFALTVAIIFIKQWLYERKLQMSLWKINPSDLTVQDALLGSLNSLKSLASDMFSVAGSMKTVRMAHSHLALRNFEENLMKEVQKRHKQGKMSNAKDKECDILQRITAFGAAKYKSNLVGLKRIHKTNVDLSRQVKIELKLMCDIKHDNLCGFVGAVVEPNLIFIVTDYCSRGSLKDMLENEIVQLDNMFVSSIVFDIIKGLTFVHNSIMKCHGNLKSTNCLVDSRWVIKLSGFGLQKFKSGQQIKLTEDQTARRLLWTAPELLSNAQQCELGSHKGDIYSFGIILYEIFGRNGPFGTSEYLDAEIVEKVRQSTAEKPFRPDVSSVANLPPFASEAMQKCWAQNPLDRPNLHEVKKILKPLSKGLKSNIFDNMLAMMEKYTNNLEDIVAERTKQLEEERRKSEKLLLMMLPKAVADKLKSGQPVEAETFDSVSIYFSDIVGFTSMSSDSTPMQIVAFLNDLYTCFDSVVGNYDVYKVETIGDAYMVVSGLPVKNGNNHAGEIASMSLNLLREIKIFKIRHRPNETLKLRIGIHSGSVVSGVVGLKMPRYCLFGDTVNTASRMESNGEALKIHCSCECKAILDTLGGYEAVERGLVAIKGKGELLTYWIVDEEINFRKERIRTAAVVYPSLKKYSVC